MVFFFFFIFLNHGLDLPLTVSSPIFIHISGLTSDCQLFTFFIWTYLWLPVFHFFIHLDLLSIASSSNFHSPGLTLHCQSNSFSSFHFIFLLIWTYSLLLVKLIFIIFSFTHLDLLSIANQTHSYPLIWTYPRVPVLMLWLRHSCLPDWTYTSDASLVDILDSLKVLDFD